MIKVDIDKNLQLTQKQKRREKQKLNFLSYLPLLIVLFVAFLNHLLTFLAYDWYAGIDNYSYDVCGLQLVSGQVFDLFPILFRPPLVPIFKNILYLIFEGHPYALSIFIHFFGVGMAVLAYRLGTRFHWAVGFAIGMFVALSLQMSVFFHHISTFTFFVPFLLLAADCFIAWVRKPNIRLLVSLGIIVFLCFLTLNEAVILIPVFAIFGWFVHHRLKQTITFLLMSIMVYNFVCFFYYTNFGYWGITHNIGWALFTRVTRAKDNQFSITNGPASRKVHEYLSLEWPSRVKDDLLLYQMFAFNLAQQELGYLKADRLF